MRHAPLLGLLLAGPAFAQSGPSEHLRYGMYAAGIRVVTLDATVRMDASSYTVQVIDRTTGLVDAILHTDQTNAVFGRWGNGDARPLRFSSDGVARGAPRRTLIDYEYGQPVVRAVVPPAADEREPVTEAQQRDTIDTLSAMATLVRQVADTGRCDGSVRVFDGRRLSVITARTVGVETLTAESGAPYAGPALRCDFEGVEQAGFLRDDGPEERHRPHDGTAWLARIAPGLPPLPVRMSFETKWFGRATAWLETAVAGDPGHPGAIAMTGPAR